MDPIIENDWLGCKSEPVKNTQNIESVVRSWQWRERGIEPRNGPQNKTVLENIAEDILVHKSLNIKCCDLPGYPRSTFLMVFSPDGTKVASTHGNHNIYVSELSSGKHVRILKGHPRTPWCVAFHPSHRQLIASGCLGGQARVWDLSGGSETWTVERETVIASIAFHPRDQLLVIATYNELYFWDWSQPAPFTKVSTNNLIEKVRYVAFDPLGYKLITGISICSSSLNNNPLMHTSPQQSNSTNNEDSNRRDPPNQDSELRPDEEFQPHDMIVNSYQNLVQRYDSLERDYRRLFMARHQLTNMSPTNTTDRGTDPMESDLSSDLSMLGAGYRPLRRAPANVAGPSRRQENSDNYVGAGDTSHLHLDIFLPLNRPRYIRLPGSSSSREAANVTQPERPAFGSRLSAFQPLYENSDRRVYYGTIYENEVDASRLLPNPFSSPSNQQRSSRLNSLNTTQPSQSSETTSAGSSRTSVFVPQRQDSAASRILLHRRIAALLVQSSATTTVPLVSSPTTTTAATPPPAHAASRQSSVTNSSTRPSHSSTQRPSTSNSATQMNSFASINETLDLIRDILRDSGTRLLNLITNMSLTTLASVERSYLHTPRRSSVSHTQSDDSEDANRAHRSPRQMFMSSRFRREFISSASDSDSDHSLEVNIYRTTNTSFAEEGSGTPRNSRTNADMQPNNSSNRMEVNLDSNTTQEHQETRDPSLGTHNRNRINVSVRRNRFRIRTQNRNIFLNNNEYNSEMSSDEIPPEFRPPQDVPLDLHTSRPSTSREDNMDWMDNPLASSTTPGSSREAYNKVKAGVIALQKHTVVLSDIWLRGTHTSLQEIRKLWENLRRHVLSLQRQTGRNDIPSYYTRSISERCRLLTEMSRNNSNSNSGSPAQSSRNNNNRNANNGEGDDELNNNVNSTSSPSFPSTSSAAASTVSPSLTEKATSNSSHATKSRSSTKKRNLHTSKKRPMNYRRGSEDDSRRQSRGSNRHGRRDNTRSVELHFTRNEVRLRAMQVLSILFNMMMGCLQEGHLSQLIIYMLRTLKKALSLTCLLLVTNRIRETSCQSCRQRSGSVKVNDNKETSQTSNAQVESEHERHNKKGERNVHQTDSSEFISAPENIESSFSSWSSSDSDDKRKKDKIISNMTTSDSSSPLPSLSRQRWSNRLAVQISAANRNFSAVAGCRRDIYVESKRQKALHKCNPKAHPIVRKRVLPPTISHGIPLLRSSQPKPKINKGSKPNNTNAGDEAIAGPSTSRSNLVNIVNVVNLDNMDSLSDLTDTRDLLYDPISNRLATISNTPNNVASHNEQPAPQSGLAPPSSFELYRRRSGNPNLIHEFQHRIHLYRIAHMHAIRLRNAARSRVRRLNSIRLFAPTALREMIALYSNNNENQDSNESPLNNATEHIAILPPFNPPLIATRNDLGNRDGARQNTTEHRAISDPLNPPLIPTHNDLGNRDGARQNPAEHHAMPSFNPPLIATHNDLGNRDGASQNPAEHHAMPSFNPPLIATHNDLGNREGARQFEAILNNVAVPLVQVNDLPVNDVHFNAGGNLPRVHEYLQPIILAQNALVVEEGVGMGGLFDTELMSEIIPSPIHRIQAWDFTSGRPPDIADSTKNIVVHRCRIHNDASIDISKDGRVLVALLPVPRIRNTNHRLGVYSLEWGRLGQCLHTAALGQSAVSVALSPTSRYLAVGLGARRITTLPHARNNVFALLFKLAPLENNTRTSLIPVKELKQDWERAFTSLNCLRWAPQPGQGLVYANNTGQLIVMR